jgi:hypothetical protein
LGIFAGCVGPCPRHFSAVHFREPGRNHPLEHALPAF